MLTSTVPSSFLEGKIFPPEAQFAAQGPQTSEKHKRTSDEEQNTKTRDAPKEEDKATQEIIQMLRQLAISMGLNVDEDAPLSPAVPGE